LRIAAGDRFAVALATADPDDLGPMTATILITGFGPFPGAPYNPTGPLVIELARRRHPAFANVRRVAHIFPVSYEAVDRELPALLKRERPDALIMFGLAVRAKQIRAMPSHAWFPT
jgi:pyrrolidone-carboxylate peptidase